MAAAAKKKAPAPTPLPDAVADSANPAVLAAAEEMGKTKPEGMPHLWPLHAVPRRKRAQIKRDIGTLMGKLDEQQKAMTALRQEIGEDATDEAMTRPQRERAVEIMADLETLAADVVDSLALAAQDSEAFVAWGESVEDQDVFDALAWFWRNDSSGEATGSQTS